MKAKTKTPDFRRFWAMLKQMPGYSEDNRDDLKCELVRQFSDGSTESLSAMYRKCPGRYIEMLHYMQNETRHTPHFLKQEDIWRRRVIASICGYLDVKGYDYKSSEKVKVAKATACRAAGVSSDAFNRIPVLQLREIYNAFRKMSNTFGSAVSEAGNLCHSVCLQVPVTVKHGGTVS